MSKLPKKEAHNRIKLFITDILEMGNQLMVRDDGKVVWRSSVDEDILIVPNKNAPAKTLYVYAIDVQDPNAIILNPINETVVMSQDNLWFYKTINKLMQDTFCKVLRAIIDVAIKAKKNIEELKDPAIAHLLSPFVNDVDEKMKTEVELITNGDNFDKIIYITYLKKTQTSSLYTLFQDKNQEFIKSIGNKVRKKFWSLLERVFQEIFSKEEVASENPIYEVSRQGQYTCPRFRTFIDVLVYTWKMMLPFYPLIYINEDDVDKITDRIQNSLRNLEEFDDFYDVCFWSSAPASSSYLDELKKPLKVDIPDANENTRSQTALEALGIHRGPRSSSFSTREVHEQGVPRWRRALELDSPRSMRYDDRYNDTYYSNTYSTRDSNILYDTRGNSNLGYNTTYSTVF